jgi:hypothetical protein
MMWLWVVMGLLALVTPADAAPTWRLLGPSPASFYFSFVISESEGAGRLFLIWAGSTWLFNPVTNVWELQTTQHGPSWYENFGADYDPTNNLFWLGQGSPQGNADGQPVSSAVFTYEPATGQYVNHKVIDPGGCGSNAAYAWHNNALFCWGGYQDNPMSRKITSPNGAWAAHPNTNRPAAYPDGARYTAWRGGVNRTQNYLWNVGANNELYKCPIVAQACTAWTQVPTTGLKPTARFVGYVLDESRNKIVGWVGVDTSSSGEVTPVVNQTYMLDLTTNVWSLGPGPSDPHPPQLGMTAYAPVYDRVRNRVLWVAPGPGGVWWYDDDGTGPPAGTPPRPPPTSKSSWRKSARRRRQTSPSH